MLFDAQDDVADTRQQVDLLTSRLQNMTDLLVQARYNSSHDLPLELDGAAADKTVDEQV